MSSARDAGLAEEKRALRLVARAARDRLTAAEHARASQAVCDRLVTVPEVTAARTLAAFAAARGEVDVQAAVWARRSAGVRVAYPRVAAGGSPRLKFHAVVHPGQLRPGAFGILEPAADTPEVPVEELDVILTPGLGFDPTGRRLGYGGGYYDELGACLRRLSRGFLLGIGFDFQILETVPAGQDDVSIDCVVTDTRLIRCHKQHEEVP